MKILIVVGCIIIYLVIGFLLTTLYIGKKTAEYMKENNVDPETSDLNSIIRYVIDFKLENYPIVILLFWPYAFILILIANVISKLSSVQSINERPIKFFIKIFYKENKTFSQPEIIHCKNCMYTLGIYGSNNLWCSKNRTEVSPEHFCGRAERRTYG